MIDGDTVVTASGEKVRLQMAFSGLTFERRGRDRYGRTLATAKTPTGADMAAPLIRAGLARPSEGRGPRGGWCTPGR